MTRHFIIANGSSLNQTPLELLKDEVTWGMNRIHLHYPENSWRPTYYFMTDWSQQNPHNYWHDCVNAHRDIPKWLWRGFRDGDRSFPDLEPIGEVENTTWIERCKKHHYYMGDNHMKRAESWHLPEICTAFSSVGAVMQLAYLNGASEIYLVGADLYTGGDYDYGSEIDSVNMTQVHRVASRSCPVPIYNATIGGALEVHKRVDFYEALNG